MMSCPKCAFALISIVVICVIGAVQAWDLSVITPAQIQFFTGKVVENTAADRLKNMVAATYDPIKKDLYVSDTNQKVGSIFRIKTTGENAYTVVEPVVAKQSATVQGMAFDDRTSTLYWTTGNGLTINYVHVPENATKIPLTGKVLLQFKDEIPQGIAIDTCRGYLYWTNCNHLNATIERSLLDGSERKVVVHNQLFQPLGIAIDVEQNLLYWSDEREGMYYSIESSDLDGGSRRTLIHGTHHQPFAIALDEQNVYWSDWVNNAVWNMSKNSFQGGVQPERYAKYESINTPMGLVTSAGNTVLINDTHCKVHREKNIEMTTELTPEMIPYEALRHLCKNDGVLHANGTCTCALGFKGENCEISVCEGYCKAGTCAIDGDSGQPKCQGCPVTMIGNRCEEQLCKPQCQNNGECVLDPGGTPRCECPVGYVGDACQFKLSLLGELCSVFCQHATQMSKVQQSACRCDEYRQFADYSSMAMLNHSDCKVSKSVVAVMAILVVFVASLGTITLVLFRKVRLLGRRPRIKKRIVVNKSITPLQSCRPPQQQNQQCEITIENCCNMNICETPCFEPDFRSPKMGGILSLSKSKKEDKANLLSNTDMSSEDEKPSY